MDLGSRELAMDLGSTELAVDLGSKELAVDLGSKELAVDLGSIVVTMLFNDVLTAIFSFSSKFFCIVVYKTLLPFLCI